MAASKTQDLPPPGGYKSIAFARNPAKQYFKGWQLIAGYFGITTASMYLYWLNYKDMHYEEVESRSAKFAIYPLLLAERDREFLKQCRRNRDEEAKLMANVPGWKVGTWYGEPIFKTLDADKWVEPSYKEFYAHTSFREYAKRAHIKMWT